MKTRVKRRPPLFELGGPPSKPKYILLIDSEQVPWGKGEIDPVIGSETDPETECLQAVEAPKGVTVYLLHNGSASKFMKQA